MTKTFKAGALLAFALAEGVVAHPRPAGTAVDGVRIVGATDILPDDEAYARGKRLLAADDIPGALAAFRQALTVVPDSADAMNGVGVAYDRLGRTDLARSFYQAALAIEPTSPTLLNNLGYSLFLSGNRAAAIAPLRAAAASDDTDASAAARSTLARLATEPCGSRAEAAAAPAAVSRIEVTSDGEQRLTFAAPVAASDILSTLGDDAQVVVVASAWSAADDATLTAQVRADEAADKAIAIAQAAASVPSVAPAASVAVATTTAPPANPGPSNDHGHRAATSATRPSPAFVLAAVDVTSRRRVGATSAAIAAALSNGPQPRRAAAFDSDDAELNAFATRVRASVALAATLPGDRARIAARFRA